MNLYQQQKDFLEDIRSVTQATDTITSHAGGGDSKNDENKNKTKLSNNEERINIYRNNFFAGLYDILITIYPSVEQLVGEQAFKLLSQKFWLQYPPTSPIMTNAGHEFANFLADDEALSSLPYLADVATLDYRHNEAYYAQTIDSLSLESIAQFPPTELACSQFTLTPSLSCVTSSYAIFDIWQMHYGEQPTQSINAEQKQNVIVYNHETDVNIENISDALAIFIRHLQQGYTLEQALNEGMACDDDFDPSAAVSFLIQHQLIINIKPTNK